MGCTDRELETLLADIEPDRAERKEAWKGDASTSGREAVCAFANDLPDHGRPGILFVGAEDDGTPSGLTVTDELLCTLAAIRTDGNILPPPSILVEKRPLCGVEMAVVTVQPPDAPPVRYKGRIEAGLLPDDSVGGRANADDPRHIGPGCVNAGLDARSVCAIPADRRDANDRPDTRRGPYRRPPRTGTAPDR
ncbi:MAG: ATP-binding protein [Deltaproteobacteria bacterium]|nr:ATP-binding protein [Deltaproteobacteria bacterium]